MHHIKEAFDHIKNKNGKQPLHQPSQEGRFPGNQVQRPRTGGYPGPQGQQPQQPSRPPASDQQKRLLGITQHAIDVFMASKQPNGEIGGIGYWQTANGYTAIALHDAWSGTNHNASLLREQIGHVGSHHRNLINEFNDDTLWWGHCLLDVCQTNFVPRYLEIAQTIWTHVNRSMLPRGQSFVRNMDMQGAVMWTTRPKEDQVNAITTGLFSELSSRLAIIEQSGRTGELINAAERSLDWILRCRYRAHECIVLDTIKLRSQECVDWTFTYCTGQAIAASAALYSALCHTGQSSHIKMPQEYLKVACDMARKSINRKGWVESDGTLTEHGAYGKGNHEPWKNDDAVGFKSVLLRSLAKLLKVLRETNQETELQQELSKFIKKQFDSLQERDTNGNGQYGPWWAGPFEMPTSHSQMAALDALAAIHLVQS